MRGKETLITLAVLAAIAVVSVLAYRHVTRPPEGLCRVCLRGLHHGVNYRLELENGRVEIACCPRCGLHLALARPGAVRRAWATDLHSGDYIPAESALYVEGGDVEYCTLHSRPVEREPQGVAVRAYDRCLPTVVAFRTREGAEAYRREHGGRILDYQQVLESVKAR